MKRQRMPLLPVLIGLIAAILLCYYVSVPWLVVPICLLTLAGAIYYHKFYISTIIVTFMSGIIICKLSLPQDLPEWLEDEKLGYTGIIEDISEASSGEQITVSVTGVKWKGEIDRIRNLKTILTLFEFETGLEPGDHIEFSSTLMPINFKPDLPDERDYTQFYYSRGITSRGYVGSDDIKIVGRQYGFRHLVFNIRKSLYKTIDTSELLEGSKNFIKALIFGDSDNISKVQRAGFTAAGLAHILALSGTHVAIICSFIFFLFLPFRKILNRNIIYLFSVIALWSYTLLTGLSPSVVRASIMITILLVARMTSRRPNSLNALIFAAVLILIFNPAALFTPSFQLSFAAVAAILLFMRYFNRNLIQNNLMGHIAVIIMVSIVAMSGTGLIAAYYFHTFPTYFIFANVPAAVLVPLFIWTGVAFVIFESLDVHLSFLGNVIDLIHETITGIAEHFASLPGSTIDDIYFSAWLFVPFGLFIFCLIGYLSERKRIYLSFTTLSLIACAILFAFENRKINENAVYFAGNSYGTDIIFVQGTNCNVYTTRTNESPENLLARISEQYRDFFAKRGIKVLSMLPDRMNTGKVKREGNVIQVDEKRIYVSDRRDPAISSKNDYCVVTRGIGQKELKKLTDGLENVTFILPKEMNSRTEHNFKEYLELLSIQYHSLRDSPLRIDF